MKKYIFVILILFIAVTVSASPEYTVIWKNDGIMEISGTSLQSNDKVTVLITNDKNNIKYADQTVSGEDASFSFKTKIDTTHGLKVKVGGSFTDVSSVRLLGAQKKEIFVSRNGSDTNDGTAENPLKTLGKAAAISEDGGTIRILGEVLMPDNVTYAEKTVTVTGGTIDITSVSNPVWDGNIIFNNVTFKANPGQGLVFLRETHFNENVIMTEPLNITGGCITVNCGAYNTITADILYVYNADGIMSIKDTDIIVFQNGIDYSDTVTGSYQYLIKSGTGGNVLVRDGRVMVFPFDGRAYSVDNGEYTVAESELTAGVHSVTYAYDFILHSISLKENARGYTAMVSASLYNLNNDPNKNTPLLIAAVYDGENLVQMASKRIQSSGPLSESVELNRPSATDFQIKVYIWDSFERLQPLTTLLVEVKQELENADSEFYVSADGRIGAYGTFTDPFPSIEAARDKARKTPGKDVVYIKGGEYKFSSAIDFTAEDKNTVYQAYHSEEVIFTTTEKIPYSAFSAISSDTIKNRIIDTEARNRVVCVNLPELGITDFGSIYTFDHAVSAKPEPTLSIDGKKMTLARYPNSGYLNIESVDTNDIPSFSVNGLGNRPAYWTNAEELWAYGYFYREWADCAYNGNMSLVNSKYRFLSNSAYVFSTPKAGQRVYFANLLEEIDSQGEWYLDRTTGNLYIYPPENISEDSILNFTIYKSNMPWLININGANEITFRGIKFDSVGPLPFNIQQSNGITVSNCEFSNVISTVYFAKDITNCFVSDNYIHDVSRTGISLSGGNSALLVRGNNYISNNTIRDYAQERKTYAPAISINGGVGTTVSHNDISSAAHSAIQFAGQKNIFEYNKIYDVCLETADSGAIYSGRSWLNQGNVIRYNYLSNIKKNVATGIEVHSVYLDDLYSSAKVYGNVFYDCQSAGLIGGGRDNSFYNNIIIDCEKSLNVDSRGLNDTNMLNVVRSNLGDYYKNDAWKEAFPLLYRILEDEPELPKYNVISKNVLFNTPAFTFSGVSSQYVTRLDNISVNNADIFLDYENRFFGLKQGSDVYNSLPDFEDIPFHEIGIVR